MRSWIVVALVAACQAPPEVPGTADGDTSDGTDGPDAPLGLDARGCTDAAPAIVDLGRGDLRVQTEHVTLEVFAGALDAARADELGRLAEAAWPAWQTAFGATPPAGITARIYADADAYRAGLAADGLGGLGGDGGYFSQQTDRAYLWVQPTTYYTRVLLLHELTHAVHLGSRTSTDPVPFWVGEGLAEHLARHDWDGRCVRLGAVPTATQEDLPARALDTLDRTPPYVPGWVEDDAFPDRATIHTFWRWLTADGPHAAAGRAWWRAADRGEVTYADGLASRIDLVAASSEWLSWLPDAQLPYSIVFRSWTHVGPGRIDATSELFSALRRKQLPDGSYTASHSAPTADALAGVLVSWTDADRYLGVLVAPNGEVRGFDAKPEGNLWVDLGRVAPPTGAVDWSVHHDGDQAVVDLDGIVLRVDRGGPAAAGVVQYAATTAFTLEP